MRVAGAGGGGGSEAAQPTTSALGWVQARSSHHSQTSLFQISSTLEERRPRDQYTTHSSWSRLAARLANRNKAR